MTVHESEENPMLASIATYVLWLVMTAMMLCIVIIGGTNKRAR